MKFLKFHEFLDRGGMLCPWGRKMGFGADLRLIQTPSVYVNITPATILISSLTFLVLGPIDLTNGRAGVVGSSHPRCAGLIMLEIFDK
jgi:hypothetical protein